MQGTTFNTSFTTTRTSGTNPSRLTGLAGLARANQSHLQGGIFGAVATLLILWSWQLLPAGHLTNGYAAWLGVGAFSLAGVAVIEAELGRALLALGLAGLGFALAYLGLQSVSMLGLGAIVLATAAFLLAPRAYADTLHAAGWHYAMLALATPILI